MFSIYLLNHKFVVSLSENYENELFENSYKSEMNSYFIFQILIALISLLSYLILICYKQKRIKIENDLIIKN